MKNLILVASILLLSLTAVSAEETTVDYDQMQKAKMRQYPGGKDEQDLKVQIQLPVPQRKSGSQGIEVNAEEAASAD